MEPDSDGSLSSAEGFICFEGKKTFTSRGRLKRHVDIPPDCCIREAARLARSDPDAQSVLPCPPVSAEELHEALANFKSRFFLPDHIPSNVRGIVAEELVQVLDRIVEENTHDAWASFLLFWYSIIGQAGDSSAKTASLSDIIRRNIREKRPPPRDKNCAIEVPCRKKKPVNVDRKRIARLLQNGNISGCVNILLQMNLCFR